LRAKVIRWQEKREKRIGNTVERFDEPSDDFHRNPGGTRRFLPIAVSLIACGRSAHGALRSWHSAKIGSVAAVTTI
jgi:hypothetical protein